MGATTVKVGPLARTFEAVGLPDIVPDPGKRRGWVRFTQTAGGRTGVPAPRRVRRRPFVQWQAPLVWTTLSLTIHADGKAKGEMTGASRFPRHWIYDDERARSAHKSGLADFKDWYRKSFGRHTPWGDTDSKALVTAVETALERTLSAQIMHGGAKPEIRKVKAGSDARRGRAKAARRCSCCSTACCASRRTASGSPSTARARCSASARISRAAGGPRRWSPSRRAGSPRSRRQQLDRGALQELSKDHRRDAPDRS